MRLLRVLKWLSLIVVLPFGLFISWYAIDALIGSRIAADTADADRSNYQSDVPSNQRALVSEDEQVRWVIILTYQRCGSTFFGEMFNSNREAFYMFEPLDALYTSLYGTRQGWNVPSDISTYANGTQRTLPEAEMLHVSEYLSEIMSCNIDSLPTESLVHVFWTNFVHQMNATSGYTSCLRQRISRSKMKTCERRNPFFCGKRFGDKPEGRLDICYQLLHGVTNTSNIAAAIPNFVPKSYTTYRTCMKQLRQQVDARCKDILIEACTKHKLRAVKTVRASMLSMNSRLSAYPQLRVIHLIRDPRAVVVSRQRLNNESVLGRYALSASNTTKIKSFPLREVAVYCRSVVDDIMIRKQLETRFPERILTVRYEDLVRDLRRQTLDVYKFVGVNVPPEILGWIERNQADIISEFSSTTRATKWMKYITAEENYLVVNDICKEFFTLVENNWSA